MFTTPGNAYRAYKKGLTTTTKPGLSAQEKIEAKAALNKEIAALVRENTKLKKEMVQQYGTVRTAREQTVNQVRVAAINAYGRMGAARVEGDAEIQAAKVSALYGDVYDTIRGTAKSDSAADKYRVMLAGRTMVVEGPRSEDGTYPWGNGMKYVDAFVAANAGARGKSSKLGYGGMETTIREIETLLKEPVDSVGFKIQAQEELQFALAQDLAPALESGRITEEQARAIYKKIMPPEFEITPEEQKTYEDQKKIAQAIWDKIDKDVLRGAGLPTEFSEWFDQNNPQKDFTMEDFVKDLGGVPGDPDIEKQIQQFRDQLADLDKPQLTAYGQFEKDYLAHPDEQYLTELIGFKNPKEAAFLYASNPNALETALRTAENSKAMIASSMVNEVGEFEVTGMDAGRLAVARQLGIVGEDRKRKISPLRLRMAMARRRPVGQAFEEVAPPAEAQPKPAESVRPQVRAEEEVAAPTALRAVEEKGVEVGRRKAEEILKGSGLEGTPAGDALIALGRDESGLPISTPQMVFLQEEDLNLLKGFMGEEQIREIREKGISTESLKHFGMPPDRIEKYAAGDLGFSDELSPDSPLRRTYESPSTGYDPSLFEFDALPKEPQTMEDKEQAALQREAEQKLPSPPTQDTPFAPKPVSDEEARKRLARKMSPSKKDDDDDDDDEDDIEPAFNALLPNQPMRF